MGREKVGAGELFRNNDGELRGVLIEGRATMRVT